MDTERTGPARVNPHDRSYQDRRTCRRRYRGCRRHRNRDAAPARRTGHPDCRRRPPEADLKAAIEGLPASAEALTIAADVTREDEVKDYVRAAVDRFGTIDAFYNNAGIEGDIKSITDYSLESFRRVLDVNVVGVFLGMKYVLPVMQNRGSIINTASIAGLMGSPHLAVYSASKHARARSTAAC